MERFFNLDRVIAAIHAQPARSTSTLCRCLALKTKSLARNNKTGCSCRLAHQHRGVSHFASNQHQLAGPTMNRDDALIWLSRLVAICWFVAICGATIWVIFPL